MQHWMRSQQIRRRNHRAPPDLRLNPPTVAAFPLKINRRALATKHAAQVNEFQDFEFDCMMRLVAMQLPASEAACLPSCE